MRVSVGVAVVISAACVYGQNYFPDGSLGAQPTHHRFRSDWYTKHLRALKEESLWVLSSSQPAMEVYRFLWLRTFHHPISVRVAVRSDGTAVLTAKETDGKGGYEPGKLIRNSTRTLSTDEVRWFLERVESSSYWRLPTRSNDSTSGLDGSQWIMEAAKRGNYRIVDVWSPTPEHPVHALGIMLVIQMAKFRLLYQDVY
jgi:hypothetical protein